MTNNAKTYYCPFGCGTELLRTIYKSGRYCFKCNQNFEIKMYKIPINKSVSDILL